RQPEAHCRGMRGAGRDQVALRRLGVIEHVPEQHAEAYQQVGAALLIGGRLGFARKQRRQLHERAGVGRTGEGGRAASGVSSQGGTGDYPTCWSSGGIHLRREGGWTPPSFATCSLGHGRRLIVTVVSPTNKL